MGLTRTGIENYRNAVSELYASADAWRTAAEHIETAVDSYVSGITGADWAGSAADAAEASAYSDRGVAYDAAAHLRTLGRHADLGASNLNHAYQQATEAIAAAEADGFAVADADPRSIRDTRRYDITTIRARNAALAEHSDAVTRAVERLVAEDNETANTLTAHNELASFVPARWRDDAVVKTGGHVTAVDYKTDAGPGVNGDNIGPFPVPPSVKAQEKPLPPAPPVPPPPPWEAPIRDLQRENEEQKKKIAKLEENGHSPTVAGVLGAAGTGCAGGALTAAIAGAPTGPGEGVAIPAGCVIGGAGGLVTYFGGIWFTNAVEGGS
ncbi:hypothetical protein SEA_APOCALYPSE_41 [Mycobacterium phage Apocalypse]|uniref:Uncharacterized protein n=1 Tax=Mycobacterium phage Apocalypse TaxID=2027890 RepID=A0A249XLR9_9CAUD|nr:hypothetical protein I5G93_gp63 [Mycobacterium phage Apocalypse]ASZ72668.1 hypothetical protein SEA_APOCALYPSE_41 [Mycobacterium phage Apocalypse]